MKKLALAIATLLFAATPAIACPDEGHGDKEKATKTADKKQDKAKDAKGQEKEKAKPDTRTAKPEPKKQEPKKDDKVSKK
jgi:hypothetical protein